MDAALELCFVKDFTVTVSDGNPLNSIWCVLPRSCVFRCPFLGRSRPRVLLVPISNIFCARRDVYRRVVSCVQEGLSTGCLSKRKKRPDSGGVLSS